MEYRDSLSWRVFRDNSGDHFMFFDPTTECPGTRNLTEDEKADRVDTLRSVSSVIRSDQLELIDDGDGPPDSLEDLPF